MANMFGPPETLDQESWKTRHNMADVPDVPAHMILLSCPTADGI